MGTFCRRTSRHWRSFYGLHCVMYFILNHHFSEAIVFPFLNQKLDFSNEMEQHKGIHDALTKILTSLSEMQATPAKFDVPRLKELMLPLRDPLVSSQTLSFSINSINYNDQLCLSSSSLISMKRWTISTQRLSRCSTKPSSWRYAMRWIPMLGLTVILRWSSRSCEGNVSST